MLISISVTYEDINSSTPRLKMHMVRKRRKPNRKKRPATDPLVKLKRELSNLRSQIARRLDAIKFRFGDPKKLAQKRAESNKLAMKYNMLKRRIATISNARKAVGA